MIGKRIFKIYAQLSQETITKETLFVQFIIFNGLFCQRIMFYYFRLYITYILKYHYKTNVKSINLHPFIYLDW